VKRSTHIKLSAKKGMIMTIRRNLTWLALAVFVLSGCAAPAVAVLAVGAAAGTGVGTYAYVNGELVTDYHASFDKVWSACEKTIADMRGYEVQPEKGIGDGTISAVIEADKVKFSLKYKNKNTTNVAIRVGLIGNRTSSQLLHDRIHENLEKAEPEKKNEADKK
jgi:hypothetical protein